MSINELFTTENNATTTNARALTGTAELTAISNRIATSIIRQMEEQIEDYKPRIAKSTVDAKELDAIINDFKPFEEVEELDENSELRSLNDDVVENILKSQQSKRSRTKSKTMTLDNYRNYMSAAIAEDIMRELYDKPKTGHGGFKRGSIVDFTPEELEALAEDQEALRKEIRNIQSKKSIMKSKADFDESDERWQALLRAEIMLKDLRVGGDRKSVV